MPEVWPYPLMSEISLSRRPLIGYDDDFDRRSPSLTHCLTRTQPDDRIQPPRTQSQYLEKQEFTRDD